MFEHLPVLVRIGKFCVMAAFIAMTGAHWATLQTVAWTTMLANNLHSGSLHDALVKTFDGKHPCCLCKTIAAGKKSEQKKELNAPTPKLEFLPVSLAFVLIAPSPFHLLRPANVSAALLSLPPPTPPPRSFFV